MSKKLKRENYIKNREQVFKRDNWQCRVCRYRSNLATHHVVFRSHGGNDELNNLITLCVHCHYDVHQYHVYIEWNEEKQDFVTTHKMSWEPKMKVR